ncbi:MAG TPA: alpha/beta hydrolase [Pseudosphingobacterium sp.]|nr:alpha/beta hydrolase [Pseudosphingobacterium sp.]
MITPEKLLDLVLIPGFMADETLWADMDIMLREIGRPIAKVLTHGDTIQAMATHILDSAPPHFVLIGFSMGGYVARQMLHIAPERIIALILIASSLRPDTVEQRQSKISAVQAMSSASFGGLSRAAIKLSLHPQQTNNTILLERIRMMGIRLGKDVFIRQSMLQRGDDREWLSNIDCPTLVIGADEDQLRSLEETKELCNVIPNAELKIIPNSGHMIPIEQPEVLAKAIISWIRKKDLV